MQRISFLMLVLEGLVGLHRTIQLQLLSFFSITGQSMDLDYCNIGWFVLEMNRDHFVIFEIAYSWNICICMFIMALFTTVKS